MFEWHLISIVSVALYLGACFVSGLWLTRRVRRAAASPAAPVAQR